MKETKGKRKCGEKVDGKIKEKKCGKWKDLRGSYVTEGKGKMWRRVGMDELKEAGKNVEYYWV